MASYEWDGVPPTIAQRICAGAYLLMLLMLIANSHFGWRIVGAYDRQATTGWAVVGLVLFLRFMPRVRRVG